MQHYIRTVTGQTIILQEKDILISQLILMLGKFHIHKKKNGRFQFSSSVNFFPTFDSCQSKLTALFSHHPKSCQNIHEHDITFQVLTVITEKNKYKKVTVFFFFKLWSIKSYAFALFKFPQQIQLFLPRDSSFECFFFISLKM